MVGKTHFMAGLATGMLAAILAQGGNMPEQPAAISAGGCVLALSGGIVGGMFPDIDLHTSKMGSHAGLVSTMIEKVFGHRTLFHSPILYILLWFAATSKVDSGTQLYFAVFAFFLGVTSHLFLDMLNEAGIPLFYPKKKRYHLMTIELGSFMERLLRFALSLCTAYLGIIFIGRICLEAAG